MSAADRLAGVAERVIVEHSRCIADCSCGYWFGDEFAHDEDRVYAAHLAAMVAAALVDELGLREDEQWALLYADEDDGERWVDRAGAENRVEEIREGIEDGEYANPEVYDDMRIARETRLVSDWTADTGSKEQG